MDEWKIRILLVEDEAPHAELARRAFARHTDQFQLSVAGSLAQARRYLSECTPDVLITDWALPDGRGTDLLPGVGGERGFPIVVMTSYGSEHLAVEAMKAGALDYVVKSAEALRALPRIVERALREWNHIQQRIRAEAALRASQAQLEIFFSQSLDGFFFMMLDEPVRWDEDVDKEQVLDYVFSHQRVTKVNDAMLAQYGVAREEFLGLTPQDFFAHDLPQGRAVWREFFDHGRLHVETDERKSDGTPMWVEGEYVCLYDERGRITGHFGIQREITQRKQAEADREELIGELEAALTHVKQLEGFLPICSYCKKIRDDKNYWQQVETYIEEHSEALFTHTFCPDCYEKHVRPELEELQRSRGTGPLDQAPAPRP